MKKKVLTTFTLVEIQDTIYYLNAMATCLESTRAANVCV